jgi:cell division protein FtsQ
MNEFKGKIAGVVLLFFLLVLVSFLVFFQPTKKTTGEDKVIEITGNQLLTQLNYLSFAKLDGASVSAEVTLPVIKDRLEKHPYISKADVEYLSKTKIKATVTEKNIFAIILSDEETFFITEDFEVLPILPNVEMMEFPLISNLRESKKIKALKILRSSEMLEAFRIIEAARFTEMSLYKNLVEINLRNGGDIILTFSGMKAPIIFGHGHESRKMLSLEVIFKEITDAKKDYSTADYIDLRFSNEIYIGKSFDTKYQSTGLSE